MSNNKPSLEEVIEAIKSCYSLEDAAKLSIAYEGNKVEYQGETWYEITTADSTSYTSWCTVLEGEYVDYDGLSLDPEDRIPEIDAKIAADYDE